MEEFVKSATEKFGATNIIICDSGIYYITLRDDGGHHYEGMKVLDNLKLSQEEYEFDEIIEYDELGGIVSTEYKIKVKGT